MATRRARPKTKAGTKGRKATTGPKGTTPRKPPARTQRGGAASTRARAKAGSRAARRNEAARRVEPDSRATELPVTFEPPGGLEAERQLEGAAHLRSGVAREAAEQAPPLRVVHRSAAEPSTEPPPAPAGHPEDGAFAWAQEKDTLERDAARERDRLRDETPWADERGDLPGAASMGIELAIGALRLARALATAPIRIGLAFLRR